MTAISIIVPVYNAEKTLPRCIDSILAQTFTDYELILVDDGSSDGSLSVCSAYAARDSRIRVLHQENAGVSAARNAGLDAAAGKYIMFCDSDDEVEPEWCALLHQEIEAHPDSWVLCGVSRENAAGSWNNLVFGGG